MKLLHILHTEAAAGWGGQEIRVLQETRLLLERGHRVSLVCQADSPLEERARSISSSRFHLIPISMKSALSLWVFLTLYRYVSKNNLDVIHTHSSVDSWLGGVVGKLSGVPVIRTRHVSLPVNDFFPNHLLYSYIPQRILTSGNMIADIVKQVRCVDSNKVVSIPAGVDLRKFDSEISGEKIREELKVDSNQILIGKIGVVRGWKGHNYFLEAIPLILKKIPYAKFVIVGDGPGFKEIKSKVKLAGIDNKVDLLGHREDVPEIMAALDVQVLASFAGEGTPQVIPQAFAMKTPVVATKIASIPDLLGQGERGILIEPENALSLAEGVLKIIRNSEVASHLVENASSFCLKELTVDKMMDSTIAIYEEVASSPQNN
ncbi:MAG TPA: glycosyltransferase family 1 protein [Nitrospina sp.]|nr:glycosyltransferase family 1 protein [Nitrospina sp.]